MTEPLFLLDSEHGNTAQASDALHVGDDLTLPKDVQRHAIQAMRLRRSDLLQLSDGRGLRIQAELTDVEQGTVRITRADREPKPTVRLGLVQALSKNGHDEQAIDMATQIGVDTVIPWQAERCIAKWKGGRTDRTWRRVLDAATEQSRRAWRPELGECTSSKQLSTLCREACAHGDLVVVLHQDATVSWQDVERRISHLSERCLSGGAGRSVTVVVGPEGGISEEEIGQLVEAGAVSCVLGRTILRASCAGPVALALASRILGRFDTAH